MFFTLERESLGFDVTYFFSHFGLIVILLVFESLQCLSIYFFRDVFCFLEIGRGSLDFKIFIIYFVK